jgi:hypothetical protein
MGVGAALIASAVIGAGTTAYTATRANRQAKLEKKRADEEVARLEKEKQEEEQAEEKRRLEFFESSRRKQLERKERTKRTFAGMQQDFNPAIMKQKLGQ